MRATRATVSPTEGAGARRQGQAGLRQMAPISSLPSNGLEGRGGCAAHAAGMTAGTGWLPGRCARRLFGDPRGQRTVRYLPCPQVRRLAGGGRWFSSTSPVERPGRPCGGAAVLHEGRLAAVVGRGTVHDVSDALADHTPPTNGDVGHTPTTAADVDHPTSAAPSVRFTHAGPSAIGRRAISAFVRACTTRAVHIIRTPLGKRPGSTHAACHAQAGR